MKRLIGLSIILLFAALTTGCDAFRTLSDANIKTSQGKPYELILVCPQAEWTGEVGDTLRAILTAPVPYINQTEPLFDVLRVTERGFRNMIAEHRNILKVLVDPSVKETTVAVQYDVTAQPQVVLTLQGPDDRSVVEYLSQHRAELVRVLEMAERDRDVAYNAKFGNPGIEEAIRKTFGIRMNVPKGYLLAASQPDFLWARYEYPTASQGFFLYSYPYAGPQSLTAAALTAARNQFAARIPGPSDGSYMTTSAAFGRSLRQLLDRRPGHRPHPDTRLLRLLPEVAQAQLRARRRAPALRHRVSETRAGEITPPHRPKAAHARPPTQRAARTKGRSHKVGAERNREHKAVDERLARTKPMTKDRPYKDGCESLRAKREGRKAAEEDRRSAGKTERGRTG